MCDCNKQIDQLDTYKWNYYSADTVNYDVQCEYPGDGLLAGARLHVLRAAGGQRGADRAAVPGAGAGI